MAFRFSIMKTFLSVIFATAALQLVSASVIREEDGQPSDPQTLQAPPVESTEQKPVGEHENKVVVQAVEHTEENNDRVDKVDGYDPNDGYLESYEVTPEEKLYAEFADSPTAEGSKPTTENAPAADSTTSADNENNNIVPYVV